MPDVLSIAVGGGSRVEQKNSHINIGPSSVGYRLTQDAFVFGGDVLTATDVAVAAGICQEIGNEKSKVQRIERLFSRRAVDTIRKIVEDAIDQIKTKKEDQPVVLVGGGSILIEKIIPLKGASDVIDPLYYKVANAVGSALSKVSGEIDEPVSLDTTDEKSAVETAVQRARERAVQAGADAEKPLIVVEKTVTPLAYVTGNKARIQVKVVGDLKEGYESMEDIGWWKELTTAAEEPFYVPETSGEEKVQILEPQEPHIEPLTGDWIVSAYDLECIAIGAGIMGCGGGGNPYIGKLRALELLKAGKEIRVIHPDRLGTVPYLSGPVGVAAMMGAPTVDLEKLMANESTAPIVALMALQTAQQEGTVKELTDEQTGVTTVINMDEVMHGKSTSTHFVSAVVSDEIGGANAMEPLAVGASCGVPVVDADGLGRAFPELQMSLPFIRGCKFYPAALGDEHGNLHVVSRAVSTEALEEAFRKKTDEYGCSAGVSWLYSCEEIKSHFVRFSLSRVRRLGDAVLKARKDKTSPIDRILEHEGGTRLFAGKIVEVQRNTTQGFTRGNLQIKDEGGKILSIEFQNENCVAYLVQEDGTKKVLASVPDLISVVDSDTGEPVATEEVRYGLRVAALALPCNPMWREPEALAVVGPQAFGYDNVQYRPTGDYVEHHTPIPKPGGLH